MVRLTMALFASVLLAACGGGADDTETATLGMTVTGNGRVTSQPAGIDCSTRCSADFEVDTTVLLTASPAAGHVFSGWSGACTGTSLTCSVLVDFDQSATATFVPTSSSNGWGSELALSAGGAGDPRVAIDSSGRAVAVWSQLDSPSSSTTSLWGSRYVPGSGWGTPQLLESNAGAVSGIYLAMDRSSGRAMVAWRQLTTTTYDLWAKSYDPTAGWGTTTSLESLSGIVGVASVGVDSSGNAMAVWSQIGPSVRYSIYASRYTFGGSWSTPELVEGSEVVGVQDGDPKVAMSPGGAAVAVWMRSTGSSASLWTNRHTTASGWGTASEVVADAGSTQWIGVHDLVLDGNGNGILAWGQVDGTANAIWYKRYTSGSWQGTPTRVSAPTSTSSLISTPVLAMNSTGAALVSWGIQDGTLFGSFAPASAAFGGRDTIRSAATATPNSLPSIGIDNQNNAFAAWSETNGNMYLSMRSAGLWSTPVVHETQTDTADMPVLAMNDLGQAVLAWRQYVAGVGTRIFVRNYSSGR